MKGTRALDDLEVDENDIKMDCSRPAVLNLGPENLDERKKLKLHNH
jgi:hypothetical protein